VESRSRQGTYRLSITTVNQDLPLADNLDNVRETAAPA